MDHQPEPRRWTFSLGVLFRAVTLIAFVLGWPLLVWKAEPVLLGSVIVALGVALGGIVGFRRFGTPWTQFKAMIGFIVGAIAVAGYSTYVADMIQTDHQWEGIDQMLYFFHGVAILASFPIVVMILVFMLRAWTWSAHDGSIHHVEHLHAD